MINILIVGLGQLGSNLGIEVAKRAYALEYPLHFHLYDDDVVEDRNVAAQWFSPEHLGMHKARAVGDAITKYEHEVDVYPIRLNPGDLVPLRRTILVDCVDNAATRYALWEYSITNGIPLLSLGNSENGTGLVSWVFGGYDTNPFGLTANSPNRIEELSRPNPDEVKMPPCELTRFRGLATNTVLAGMEALFLFLGHDVCGRVPSEVYTAGYLSTWTVRIDGYELIDQGFSIWSDND